MPTRVRKIFAFWPRKFNNQTYWLENIAVTEEFRPIQLDFNPFEIEPTYLNNWEIIDIKPIKYCR